MRHAFAVDPPGEAVPTEEQHEVVEWFCREVARRGLTTPGLIALEMSRPLNFLTSQFMHWMQPSVWAVAPARITANYDHFAKFLEQRGSVDYIVRRIEELEAEFADREQSAAGRRDPLRPRPSGASDGATPVDTPDTSPLGADEGDRQPKGNPGPDKGH